MNSSVLQNNLIFQISQVIAVIQTATILVKGLSQDSLKELKRLKVELNCKTWAELLTRLSKSRDLVIISEEDLNRMKAGTEGFLKLRKVVSRKWSGAPTVLEEVRGSRSHESHN